MVDTSTGDTANSHTVNSNTASSRMDKQVISNKQPTATVSIQRAEQWT
jgi:hypothetical protein